MTGEDAAKRLLNSQGIYDVTVRPVKGQLTDHYDPRTKTVNLSESVFHSTSVAAIGVAAHECGHAMQDNVGYVPLKLRGAIVPVANIGSQAAFPLIIIGVLIGGMGSPLVNIGLILFSLDHAARPGRYTWRPGSKSDEKGAGRRGAHIRGRAGGFRAPAAPSRDSIWRTQRQ